MSYRSLVLLGAPVLLVTGCSGEVDVQKAPAALVVSSPSVEENAPVLFPPQPQQISEKMLETLMAPARSEEARWNSLSPKERVDELLQRISRTGSADVGVRVHAAEEIEKLSKEEQIVYRSRLHEVTVKAER